LKALPKLTEVDLTHSGLNDGGLAHFTGWEPLEWLHLNQTGITDVGLGHLDPMPHLVRLELLQTKISAAAVGKYRRGHPRMSVSR